MTRAICLFALLLRPVAQAAPVPDALLGEWRGTGTVTGRASAVSMRWTRETGGAFLHLQFRNDMAASATRGAEVFEGRGYYRTTAGPTSGSGVWLDSRGMIFPVSFTLSADTLTSDWGSEATAERGRTTYRLVDRDTLEVVDFVRTAGGEYREFGRTRLTRAAR
jgi:hypothetical protein